MKKSKLSRLAALLAAGALLLGGVFMSCSSGNDDDDDVTVDTPADDPQKPNTPADPTQKPDTTVDDTSLSTHLVDLTGTGVTWNTAENNVINTADGEAYLVYNRLVDISKDAITLRATVNFNDLSGHTGVGFISVDGTKRVGYQLLTGQNIKNVGCTDGGSGQGFDAKADGFKWETGKDYIFNVSIADKKISYIVYDSDGTTELASKKDTVIYHAANDLIYPALGGTKGKVATYSNITVTVNGNSYTIDGIDPQSQLPTLTLSTNVVRIKSTETGTVTVNATYNGESANFTADSSDPSSVEVKVSGNEIIVTPHKATPSVTVTVKNSSAPYITSTFTVVVADYPASNPSSLNVYPAAGATAAYTDGNLRLTFDDAPTLNPASFVSIFDSDGNVVDTITMSDEKQTTNAGNTIKVKNQLVRVVGKDVLITPHFGVLENSKTYYVAIPEGAITGKINGNDFSGLSNEKDAANAWSFTTRETHAATSGMTVSSSESDSPDFRTIYGALAAIGTNDTSSFTINVKAGEYYELVNAKIAGAVKIVGPSTAELGGTDTAKNAVIKYINHNDWNGGTAIRPSFYIGGNGNLVLENVTIWNATRRKVDTDAQEAQAEAIYFQSTGTLAAYNSTFKSYQDTIQVGNRGGKAWFYKCYVEGDVDFLWGTADVALFENCTLKSLNDSERTTKTQDLLVARTYLNNNMVGKGFVVLNSLIEIEDGITMSFGRCAGSGDGFYDQCAVVNTIVKGTLSDTWWNEKNYTPLSGKEKFVGWKDYNITDDTKVLTPSSRCDKTYAIDAGVYKLEFNGRRTILNRVFSNTGDGAYFSGTAWDEETLSALETEFKAVKDESKDNVYGEGGSFNATSATVTWDLSSNSVNIQKILGNLKGTVTGSTDYTVRAIVDATCNNGKLQGNGSQHAQMNQDTIIKVPVTSGAVVSVTCSSAGAKSALYTIGGTAASTKSLTSTYTATSNSWVGIVSTGTAYPAKIQITGLDLDNLPSVITENYGWDNAAIVADQAKIENTKGYYDELYIDAQSGKFSFNNASWTQCNAGAVIYVPMNGAGTVSFETYGAYTITGGASKDLSTTAESKTVAYEVTANDLVSSGVQGDNVTYAKITFGKDSQYIKNLSRKYSN